MFLPLLVRQNPGGTIKNNIHTSPFEGVGNPETKGKNYIIKKL
jgi:hypothetical protein